MRQTHASQTNVVVHSTPLENSSNKLANLTYTEMAECQSQGCPQGVPYTWLLLKHNSVSSLPVQPKKVITTNYDANGRGFSAKKIDPLHNTCPMLAAAIGVSSKEANLLLQLAPRLFSSCLCNCLEGITSAPCRTRSSALANEGGITLSSYPNSNKHTMYHVGQSKITITEVHR